MKLNLVEMYLHAGIVVQFVMLVLLVFSVMSWCIIIQKFFLIRRTREESEDFLEQFWQCRNMAEANRAAHNADLAPEAIIFRSAYGELQKLGRFRSSSPEEEALSRRISGMENLERVLRKSESQEVNRLNKFLPFLATTGSATPFIGLFGTVWGIMTSFHDIGMRGSASLAIVAPGISEALVATAAGLAVAIPAVIFFNYYTNQLVGIENNMQHFSADFLNLVERDIITRASKRDGEGLDR